MSDAGHIRFARPAGTPSGCGGVALKGKTTKTP
jgi:hypothetical protein